MKRMWKICPGQSMTEYGIIACLVVVVALPALVLLSGNVNGLLSGMLGNGPGNTTRQEDASQARFAPANRVALRARPVANPVGNSEASLQGTSFEELQAYMDPATGHYVVPVLEANGGGTTTASVNGHESVNQMADLMNVLVDNWRGAEGEAMPDDLASALRSLSKHGHELARYQAALKPDDYNRNALLALTARGEETQDSKNAQKVNKMGEVANEFTNAYGGYDQIFHKYAGKPGYDKLRYMVDVYTGVITTNTTETLRTDFKAEKLIERNEKLARFSRLGIPVSAHKTRRERAHHTDQAATGIGDLADQPVEGDTPLGN